MACLFCQIAAGEIKADIVFENDAIVAFKDIKPQAPHHILIIPKKHIETINDVQPKDANLIGDMVLLGKDIAGKLNFKDSGYRLVFNVNKDGGQEVYHIHLHLLGGRQMHWPPG